MSVPSLPTASQMLSWGKDAAERVIVTFVEAFAGALVLTNVLDLSMWQNASVAGAAAVLSLVKSVAARFTGRSGSASMIG